MNGGNIMDCDDCEMHDHCIPVPGMPGKCTMTAKCEQCINERMDTIEHESALLDIDIATMRRDIDTLDIKVKKTSREITIITMETKKEIEKSSALLERAIHDEKSNAKTSIDMERLLSMVKRIKAEVF